MVSYSSLVVMLLSSFPQALLMISYKSTWISSFSQAPLMISYKLISYKSTWISSFSQAPLMISYKSTWISSLMKVLLPVHVDVK